MKQNFEELKSMSHKKYNTFLLLYVETMCIENLSEPKACKKKNIFYTCEQKKNE